MLRLTTCLCLAVLAADAQTFDVASIKPAAPPENGQIRVAMLGGPGSNDPDRITWTGVSLKMILTYAFNVKAYQIVGPDWLNSERFDNTAKAPAGATREQARIMMQNLLADRFKLTIHQETKEMASYVLTVGKNGPKMKLSQPEPAKDANASPDPKGPPLLPALNKIAMGKDGFPDLPKGAGGQAMMMMNGKAKATCPDCTMSTFLDMLGNQTDKPIVDMTGLTGKYDFTLIFEPERNMGMAMAGRGAMPPGAAGPGGGMVAGPGPVADADETAPAMTTAIQDQLGLKLDAKKAPVDLIVIDHLEKTTTEN